MQFFHRSFDIRFVYIIVFMIAMLMLIQTIGSKGGDDDDQYQKVPNQEKVNQPSSSTSEGESKEYKEGDKED
jgi:protein disulfide-isomerase A1